MGRMNQTPPLTHIRLRQKIFHRPRADGGNALLHFLLLLGHMDMHRPCLRRQKICNRLQIDRPQRMQSQPYRK